MTYNEIIKALECCGIDTNCKGCPYHDISLCQDNVCKDALDLINRQKAEIERLTEAGKEAVSYFTRMESLYKIKCKEIEIARAEAIKEFAERLKIQFEKPYAYTIKCITSRIDRIVKEMVGDE